MFASPRDIFGYENCKQQTLDPLWLNKTPKLATSSSLYSSPMVSMVPTLQQSLYTNNASTWLYNTQAPFIGRVISRIYRCQYSPEGDYRPDTDTLWKLHCWSNNTFVIPWPAELWVLHMYNDQQMHAFHVYIWAGLGHPHNCISVPPPLWNVPLQGIMVGLVTISYSHGMHLLMMHYCSIHNSQLWASHGMPQCNRSDYQCITNTLCLLFMQCAQHIHPWLTPHLTSVSCSTLAPASRRRWATLSWPLWLATCSGVHPSCVQKDIL